MREYIKKILYFLKIFIIFVERIYKTLITKYITL